MRSDIQLATPTPVEKEQPGFIRKKGLAVDSDEFRALTGSGDKEDDSEAEGAKDKKIEDAKPSDTPAESAPVSEPVQADPEPVASKVERDFL